MHKYMYCVTCVLCFRFQLIRRWIRAPTETVAVRTAAATGTDAPYARVVPATRWPPTAACATVSTLVFL